MTSGVHADLRGGTHHVAVCRGTAIGAWPQGVPVGHSITAHARYIDLWDGHAPHRSFTVYTHLLVLCWWVGAWTG